MSLIDELTQLEELRNRGSLSADEFQRAKDKLLGAVGDGEPVRQAINGFRRSANGRWLGGVCAGLAISTGIQVWFWRIAFVLLMCAGVGLLAYLLLWIFVPLEPSVPLLRSS